MLLESHLESPWLIGAGEHLCAWLFCEHLVIVEFPGSVLRLYSPSAAALWLLLSDGPTLPSLIDSMVDLYAADQAHIQQSVHDILSEWTALGWLKSERGQYQLSYQCSTPACEPMHASYSGSKGEYTATYLVQFAIPIQITIEACAGAAPPLIFDRLCAMFDGLPHSAHQTPVTSLNILIEQNRCLLFDSGQCSQVCEEHTEVIGHILVQLLKLGYPHSKLLGTLHAAGLALPESSTKGVVFSGVSGVGKSTLAVSLAERGWSYLGDDVIGLSTTNEILALPTAASLKPASWRLFQNYQDKLNELPLICYGDKTARYLPVVNKVKNNFAVNFSASFSVKHWIFPRFESNAELKFFPMSPVETLQGLIASGISLADELTESDLSQFLQLLCETPSHQLTYSDISEVHAWLTN